MAKDDTVQRLPDGALDIPVADLLANDFDFDTATDKLTLTLPFQLNFQATLSLVDGVVTYTPNPGFHGGDSFTYVLTDDTGKTSKPATVTIEIIDAPIADAGLDQTVHQGEVVMLMGSGSTTGNGDPVLDYDWNFTSKPAGSLAVLIDPTTASPTFTADVAGDYRIELVVTDTDTGTASAPNEVVISTNNTAPVADAGADQSVNKLGTLVTLNGGASDDDDGDTLTYAWSIKTKPEGSNVTLTDGGSATPSFTPDAYGDYVINLQVFDSLGAASQTDTVTVSTLNVAPVADATAAKLVVTVGETVTLDGSASSDANGDALSYSWTLGTVPEASFSFLDQPAAASPSFVPDQPGSYQASLVVNDGEFDSAPAMVTIEAVVSDTDTVTAPLIEAIDLIANADLALFSNPKKVKLLTNKLGKVLQRLEDGDYDAVRLLTGNGLLGKFDGCAAAGVPDKNDWIRDCDTQDAVLALIRQVIQALKG